MINQKVLRATAAFLLAGTATAAAGDATPSQRGYHLLKPVPKEMMRPLAADRPDATESPQTVDAGHVQLEMDIVAYLRDADVDGWSFLVTNVKFGLTHNVDLQLVVAPYSRVKTRVGGVTTTSEGFGDLVLRTKINIWGNDGGQTTALAVMPFVLFPTSQDSLGGDDIEGGIIIPVGIELPRGWSLGLQLELDVVRNSTDTAYDLDIANTVVIGHAIVGDLAGFVEVFSLFPGESGADWIGTLNAGLTYQLNENVQLDVAVFIGLSDAADNLVAFSGITVRF